MSNGPRASSRSFQPLGVSRSAARGTGVPVPPVGSGDLTRSWPRRPCHEDLSGPRMTGRYETACYEGVLARREIRPTGTQTPSTRRAIARPNKRQIVARRPSTRRTCPKISMALKNRPRSASDAKSSFRSTTISPIESAPVPGCVTRSGNQIFSALPAHVGWGDAVLVFQIGQDSDALLRLQAWLATKTSPEACFQVRAWTGNRKKAPQEQQE